MNDDQSDPKGTDSSAPGAAPKDEADRSSVWNQDGRAPIGDVSVTGSFALPGGYAYGGAWTRTDLPGSTKDSAPSEKPPEFKANPDGLAAGVGGPARGGQAPKTASDTQDEADQKWAKFKEGNEIGAKEEFASSHRKSFFSLERKSYREFSTFLQYFSLLPESPTPFLRQLQAIAAVSAGQGLETKPRRIMGIAQRSATPFAALALTAMIQKSAEEYLQLVTVASGKTAGNSPRTLAAFLTELQANGELEGEIIALLLPSEALTREWQQVVNQSEKNPLLEFLEATDKRLIISFQPAERQPLSRLVNGETRICPLSWVLPFMTELLASDGAVLSSFTPEFIGSIEQSALWESAGDDDRERNHFIQFRGLKPSYVSAEALSLDMEARLAKSRESATSLWQESQSLIDESFGLSVSAKTVTEERKAPQVIRRALLCGAAFAQGLSNRDFLAIIRASLPQKEKLTLEDLPKADQEAVIREAQYQGGEHAKLPPLPAVVDYFDRNADRFCKAYRVERSADGRMRPSREWYGFPIAAAISTQAPAAAIEFADNLLKNIERLAPRDVNETDPTLSILACLWMHLSSDLADERIAHWIIACATRPVEREAAAHESRVREEIYSLLLEGKDSAANALEMEFNNRTRVSAAGLLAFTMVEFLAELRKALAREGREEDADRLSQKLVGLLLQELPGIALQAGFVLMLAALDKDAPLSTHAPFHDLVRRGLRNPDGNAVVRNIVVMLCTLLADEDGVTRDAHNSRLLEFFESKAELEDRTILWDAAYDFILIELINMDIRWPPQNGTLRPYSGHKKYVHFDEILTRPEKAVQAGNIDRADILIRRFFARSAQAWLSAREATLPGGQVAPRVMDTIFVLLDGPPAEARFWLKQDWLEQYQNIFADLCSRCGLEGVGDPAELEAVVSGTSEADFQNAAVQKLYGLFWPAVLLHWRLIRFGAAPLASGVEETELFKAFLERLASALPLDRLKDMADGLELLARTIDFCLVMRISPAADPVAHQFYSEKQAAALNLSRFLLKRLARRSSGG